MVLLHVENTEKCKGDTHKEDMGQDCESVFILFDI